MSRRGLVILIVALVVLGGLVAVNQRQSSPAPTTVGTALVPGLQESLNDVERVGIVKAGGEAVATLEKRENTWVVANKSDYPADVAKLRQSLRALAEAKIREVKTANPEFYDRLGVVDAADSKATGVAVSITVPGKEFGTVILGNTEGAKQRYARRASEPQSYLIDRDPEVPKNASQWLEARILDVRGDRVREVTIRHADGETVTVSKASADAANFDVAATPKGRELLYPGVANVIGSSLRELNLEDVERAEGAAGERPVHVEFKTFDGLVVRATGTQRGDEKWLTFEASVDPEQAAKFAAPPAAPAAGAPTATAAAESGQSPAGDAAAQPAGNAAGGSPAAADAGSAAATSTPGTPPAAAQPDPAAEAQRINERVSGWRYKIPSFQYDQMTRRMADLLKPVA
jgi:hypothetical protein